MRQGLIIPNRQWYGSIDGAYLEMSAGVWNAIKPSIRSVCQYALRLQNSLTLLHHTKQGGWLVGSGQLNPGKRKPIEG